MQWTIENPPANQQITFKIERSGSPEGPFELIINNITTYHFFDDLRHLPIPTDGVRENLGFLSLNRTLYYRITATAGNEQTSAIEPVGDQLPRRQYLLRRKMQRDLRVGLKFSSIPLAILKRKHWGVRCKECFDLLTKKVTKSRCEVCYGTGFEGGYFEPVRVDGRISVDTVQSQMTQQDLVEVNQKTLTLLDYPLLETDDVVCELRMNQRYVVKQVARTELRTVPVHQRAYLSELSRDGIEYRLFINKDHMPAIY